MGWGGVGWGVSCSVLNATNSGKRTKPFTPGTHRPTDAGPSLRVSWAPMDSLTCVCVCVCVARYLFAYGSDYRAAMKDYTVVRA